MLYKVKYAHTDLNYLRNYQNPEWREVCDEYGNYLFGYNHYPYYNDINSDGGWYYDIKANGGSEQFYDCPILKKFIAKVGEAIEGYETSCREFFQSCENLEEVIIDMDNLTDASYMLDGCPKVHTFYANLSQLQSAGGMFGSDTYSCTSLNVESVEFIADSIAWGGTEIYIGMARELQNDYGDGKYSRCQAALQKIRDKGWTVYEMYSENY